MHVSKWNLQLINYIWVCFKFEIRADIEVLNNFWTKSVSYKSKPIPVSRNAEMRWKTITLASDISLSHNDWGLILWYMKMTLLFYTFKLCVCDFYISRETKFLKRAKTIGYGHSSFMRKRSWRAMTPTAILSGGDDPQQHSQKLASMPNYTHRKPWTNTQSIQTKQHTKFLSFPRIVKCNIYIQYTTIHLRSM